MSLRWRIILPFLALFGAAFVFVAVVSVSLVERAVERRFVAQAQGLARLISSKGFPLSRTTIEYIGEAYDAEVLVEENGKRVGEWTTWTGDAEALLQTPRRPDAAQAFGDYVTVCAPIGPRGLYLLFPAEVVERERTKAVRPVIIMAATGLLLVILLGIYVTHRIVRPIERLAAAAGEGKVPAVGGGPEMDALVAALNRLTEEVRRHERWAVMGQMAVGIAHEIRNPLAAIKMTVQMLEEEKPGGEPYRLILREIERLELATGELMTAASPRLVKGPAALDRAIDEILELLGPQLKHLSVAAVKHYNGDALRAEVDVARYKRAVLNLILNGAQAMPGGGTLSIRLERSGSGIRFSVTDQGRGVPAELRDRMFEPFVTGRQDGVGLGLALTKRIAEEHGGSIGFETSETGSTFWLDVPHG